MKNLFAFLLILISFFSSGQTVTPFTIWKQVTQRGDITFTGNSNLVCNGNPTCLTAQAAIAPAPGVTNNNYNNNANTMIYANIADASDPVARFSRTNGFLNLGSVGGCGVIYAELMWGGNILGATANYAKRDSVYFKVPGSGYVGLKAEIKKDTTIPFTGYYCYKDVTNLVRQGPGSGTYWVANVVNDNNATNLCGGWSLVVIFGTDTLPLRNLTIFRGISAISSGNPQNINISGFYTPPSGAVNLKLGVYSFEGDRGTLGDSLKFNGNPTAGFQNVTDAKNPIGNAFNSTTTNNTNEIVRSPSYPNPLGMDLDIFTPDNSPVSRPFLTNGATSATLRMTSSGDVYAPFMISTALDVFEPDIRISKSFVNLSGNNPASLGDTIEYTLTVVNKGNDPSDSVIVIDSLYGALSYIPNSIQILSGPNAGPKSDTPGNDQADYFSSGNYLKVRLGNGANGVKGGKLGITSATDSISSFKFRAKITNDCQIFHCFNLVRNTAFTTFFGETSKQGRSTLSSPSGLDAFGCPILGATELIVNVPPCTPIADSAVSNCIPYNLNNILPARPGFNSYYNNSWTPVTQAAVSGIYYAVKNVYQTCNDTIQINFTAGAGCVLPLILQQFDAVYSKPWINLRWNTQMEVNNDHFEIERSMDGINFEKISIVPGAINSQSARNYYFQDKYFPRLEKLYYRIRQVDLDGSYSFSEIRPVNLPEFKDIRLSIDRIIPNPAKDKVTIMAAAAADMVIRLRLTDVLGRQLFAEDRNVSNGLNQFQINVNNLDNGIYLLELIEMPSGTKKSERIIINR